MTHFYPIRRRRINSRTPKEKDRIPFYSTVSLFNPPPPTRYIYDSLRIYLHLSICLFIICVCVLFMSQVLFLHDFICIIEFIIEFTPMQHVILHLIGD